MSNELEEHELEEIARQIKEGYTSGHLNDGEGNALYYELHVNILSRAGDELLCPICNSPIRVKRVDDGVTVIEINTNGSCKEVGSNSDGSVEVYCSNDNEHILSERLKERALDIWEEYEAGAL